MNSLVWMTDEKRNEYDWLKHEQEESKKEKGKAKGKGKGKLGKDGKGKGAKGKGKSLGEVGWDAGWWTPPSKLSQYPCQFGSANPLL